MADSKYVNGMRKTKERERRDRRMREIVQKGKLPYAPAVMSWLSEKSGIRSSLLTQADVDRLAKA
jgi:hypothetical protein